MRKKLALTLVGLCTLAAVWNTAQTGLCVFPWKRTTVNMPVVASYAPAPVVASYAPVTTYYAPSVVAAPVTTYYAPSVVAAPVTTYYAPPAEVCVVPAPATTSYY